MDAVIICKTISLVFCIILYNFKGWLDGKKRLRNIVLENSMCTSLIGSLSNQI